MQALNGAAPGSYEPNSNDREYQQPFRHIQYNRIASFHPMATLAMLLCRRIARRMFRRLQLPSHLNTSTGKLSSCDEVFSRESAVVDKPIYSGRGADILCIHVDFMIPIGSRSLSAIRSLDREFTVALPGAHALVAIYLRRTPGPCQR
jgi:hypothetical protein